jgi:predicted AAA+ superfamily ATPase
VPWQNTTGLPMTFRDYLVTTAVEVPLPDPVGPDRLQSRQAHEAVAQMTPFVDDFDLAWQRFLECGGFPEPWGSTTAPVRSPPSSPSTSAPG